MAETIDINKLKKDAFNAIDALFSEDEEVFEVEFPIEDMLQKPEPVLSSVDDFAVLDEFILALDWEYSESEIMRLVEHLKSIGNNNPDPNNQALVKMLNSIIDYLMKAKNKAFPETFNVLSAVIGVLKKVNSKHFDSVLAKSEVSKAYQAVKDLKLKISHYNEKLKKSLITVEDLRPKPNRRKNAGALEQTIQSPIQSKSKSSSLQKNDFIDEGDIFTEKSGRSTPPAPAFDPVEIEKIESKIYSRLDEYEQRLAFLEEQNRKLKQIIIEQKDHSKSEQKQMPEQAEDSEILPEDFMVDDFSAALQAFVPGEDEPEIVDINDLLMDDAKEAMPMLSSDGGADYFSDKRPASEDLKEFEISSDSPAEGEAAFAIETEDLDKIIASPAQIMENESGDVALEEVKLFILDQAAIAIPEKYCNNFYKLPASIKNRLLSMESILLGELASMFQKLSKNMEGALKNISEKELKKLPAKVSFLSKDKTDYQYAVLCSFNDHHVIIPVSGRHSTLATVKGKRNDLENRISRFSIQIDGDETIPLIIPG